MTTATLTRPLKQVGEQLGWGLGLSFLLHTLLVLFIIFGPGLIPSTGKRVFIPVYNVSLVGAPRVASGPPGVKAAPQAKQQASKSVAKSSTVKKSAPKPVASKPVSKPTAQKAVPVKPAAKKVSAPSRPKPKVITKTRPTIKPKAAPAPKVAIGTKKTVERKPPTIVRKTQEKPEVVSKAENLALERRIQNLQRQVRDERRLDDVISQMQSRVATRAAEAAPAPAGAADDASEGETLLASSLPAEALPLFSGERGGGGGGGDSNMTIRQQVYHAEVEARIKRNWVLPEAYVKNLKGLVAWVVVRIKPDGGLAKVWLEQSSGNSRFNKSCISAVERAAPYPPLPPEERGAYLEVGIRFRPGDLAS